MYLRKDVQVVAWLIQKRIDFEALIKTVKVDESKLPEDIVFKLGQYECDPEPFHREPYKKKQKAVKVKKVKDVPVKLPVKKPSEFVLKLRKHPPVDIPKTVRVAKSIHELPKGYQRPKGEYSNPQWSDLYND